MSQSSNHAQRTPDRTYEVATTKLVRMSADRQVERLSSEQLARLKDSVASKEIDQKKQKQ